MKKITLLICFFLMASWSFGQDSLKTKKQLHGFKKVLVVEKEKANSKGKISNEIFNIGNNIICETYSSQKPVRGAIKALTDTSVVINKKTIFLKDIKSINRHLAHNYFIIIGISIITSSILFSPDFSTSVLGVIIGAFPTMGGFVSLVSTHKYKMDQGWKIYVATKEK